MFTIGSTLTFVFTVGGALALVLAVGGTGTLVLTVSGTRTFVLAVGSTLTLMLAISGTLALMLSIGGTLAFVLAVGGTCTLVLTIGSALALMLAVGSTLALMLSIGGTLAFVLAVGGTLTLVCRSSSLRIATSTGILAAGRQFGTGSGVGLEIIGIVTQVAHLLADLVGSGLLGIIRHCQLGRGFVVFIILHTLEERDILFETVHALLAVLGSICLDGHRSAGLGGRSIDFGLGGRAQREDGHESHE